MSHLDGCKDVCDHFGITTTIVPYRQEGKIAGFTVKSYRNPDKDPDAFDFDYDPMWDDGTDFERLYDGIDDELEADAIKQANLPEIENKIPDDDDFQANDTGPMACRNTSDSCRSRVLSLV